MCVVSVLMMWVSLPVTQVHASWHRAYKVAVSVCVQRCCKLVQKDIMSPAAQKVDVVDGSSIGLYLSVGV